MVRLHPSIVLLVLVLMPPLAVAQEAVPMMELEELRIVGEREQWPYMFEPETKLEPGLMPAEIADRYAYRAAEYAVAAGIYREESRIRSWPDRSVYGDGHYNRLYAGWVGDLEDAASRSRTLSVQYWLVAWDLVRTAAAGDLARQR